MGRTDSRRDMFGRLNILTFPALYVYHTCKYVHEHRSDELFWTKWRLSWSQHQWAQSIYTILYSSVTYIYFALYLLNHNTDWLLLLEWLEWIIICIGDEILRISFPHSAEFHAMTFWSFNVEVRVKITSLHCQPITFTCQLKSECEWQKSSASTYHIQSFFLISKLSEKNDGNCTSTGKLIDKAKHRTYRGIQSPKYPNLRIRTWIKQWELQR